MFDKVIIFVRKNAPTILTYMGAGGVVTTSVLAAKETPKAIEAYDTWHEMDEPGTTSVRTIAMAAKEYVPAIIVGGLTITCIFGANYINLMRIGKLTDTYNKLATSCNNGVSALAGATASKLVPEEKKDDETEHWFYLDCHQVKRRWIKSTWKEIYEAAMLLEERFENDGYASLKEYLTLMGYEPDEISHIPDNLLWDCTELFGEYECPFIPFEYSDKPYSDKIMGTMISFPIEPIISYDYI